MKWLYRNFRIVLLLALLPNPSILYADENTNNVQKGPGSIKHVAPLAWERRVKEIHWDALPLAEIVQSLRKEFQEFNFVVTSKVQAESISAVLRSVTLEEILLALEPATEGRVRVTWNQNDRLVVFDAPPRTPGDPSICRVFNLSKYLASIEWQNDPDAAIRSISEALQDGWKMLREANGEEGETMPRLSIHKGANLLIVVARPFEMNVANEIIRELQGSVSATTIPVPAEPEHDKKTKTKPAPPAAATQ